MYYSKIIVLLSLFIVISCKESENNLIPNSEIAYNNTPTETIEARDLSKEFKDYWYAGTAEITSYQLTQERYGELREGTAVTIFVTEDFLPKEQVKADRSAATNIPVLKLNQTKNYVTGIYPYSVMTSTFSPVYKKDHAIKVSHSMQEWCGHVYVQLNNRDKFNISQHSYFEGEADMNVNLPKNVLESDIWNLIRINPAELPTGNITMLPSFEYLRMSHQEIKAQPVNATLSKDGTLSTYTLQYPSLKRSLAITFTTAFPHTIESWTETHANGLTSSAAKIKRIKSAYWGQNGVKHEFLRDSLGLQ